MAGYIRFVGISLHFYLLSIKTQKKSIANLHKHRGSVCTSTPGGYFFPTKQEKPGRNFFLPGHIL